MITPTPSPWTNQTALSAARSDDARARDRGATLTQATSTNTDTPGSDSWAQVPVADPQTATLVDTDPKAILIVQARASEERATIDRRIEEQQRSVARASVERTRRMVSPPPLDGLSDMERRARQTTAQVRALVQANPLEIAALVVGRIAPRTDVSA